MIDTRLFGYVALAFILLFIYQAWTTDYGVKTPEVEPTAVESPVQDLPPADFSSVQDKSIQTTPDLPLSSQASTTAISTNLITVESDVLRLKIDPKGGTIVGSELLQYTLDLQHQDEFMEIFSVGNTYYVAQSGLQAKDNVAPDHYAEYVVNKEMYLLGDTDNELRVPLVWQDESGIKVTKTFVLKRGAYDIDVLHTVKNSSKQLWKGSQYRQLQRNYVEEGKANFLQVRAYNGGVIYSPENHYEKIEFEDMAKEPLKRNISNGWAAMIQHYFLAAWIPEKEEENKFYSSGVDSPDGQRYVLGLRSPTKDVGAGEQAEFSSKLYIGPKIQNNLEALAKGLELTVDYGYLTVISKPLFWLLQKIHSYVGNWGWSIIIVTLFIKMVFYKLAETSYRSMANMRRVQPKMTAIRERYADDRQRQSQAMMELYKKEKINPLGGCLPMVIQIPVFIALYWVLLESVELRQAPFIFWLNDLSVKDPFYVLPLLMGISMFVQQKLNPAPVDPIQAKVFMLLPFVFTVFFAFFPAGLVLYWVMNNLLTITQQWFITRRVLATK